MKKIFIFIILFTIPLLTSCSTLPKQQIYSSLGGAIAGSVVGAYVGQHLSPNSSSDSYNRQIFGLSGGALGAITGYGLGTYFWKEDPENKDLPSMIMEQDHPVNQQINGQMNELYSQVQKVLIIPDSAKKYPVSTAPIPENLKDRTNLKKPYITVWDAEAFEEKTADGTILYHAPHQVWFYHLE